MECRLVCPAHTNYFEVFDSISYPTYGGEVFLDCRFLKKIDDPVQIANVKTK
jgi:hypothetical protein